MRSILTRLKKSKTHKKKFLSISFLGILALVLAFFASTKASYADAVYTNSSVTCSNVTWYFNYSEPISTEFGYGVSWNPTGTTLTQSGVNEAQYVDFRLVVEDAFSFDSGAINKKCTGVFQSRSNYTISASCYNMSDVEILFTGLESLPGNYDITDSSSRTQSSFDSTSGRSLSFGVNVLTYFADREFYTNTVYITNVFHFRIYFRGNGFVNLGIPSISVTRTGNFNNVGSLRYTKSTEDLLTNLNNSINTDGSGKASELTSVVNSYDTAESLASSSMAGALPDASTQLSSITSYDYQGLYNGNVSAFSFWKSLGDFVLSNSSLVGIGALLILVLFAGLVVYLLRL